jgi:hypothetical protein
VREFRPSNVTIFLNKNSVIAMNKKSHPIPAAALASAITFTFATLFWLPAQAVPLLTATAGVVAGQTNGKVGCTTYGPSDQLNGFTFKTGGVPIGGIEACGYSGSFITSTGSSGTVIQSNSPPGILLGTNPQFAGTYTGNATARASFGNLGVKPTAAFSRLPDLHLRGGLASI